MATTGEVEVANGNYGLWALHGWGIIGHVYGIHAGMTTPIGATRLPIFTILV